MRYGITVVCLWLVVVLSVSMLPAQTGGAMLYANGKRESERASRSRFYQRVFRR